MPTTIRFATEDDIQPICDLVNGFAAQNLMLPRHEYQVRGALTDFLVACGPAEAADGASGRLLGCGSLIALTPELAEIRSLAVSADAHGQGVGGQIVGALLDLGRERGLDQVCALTLRPNFFQRQGFHVIDRWGLTPKIWNECVYCPKFHRCDEIAVVLNLHEPHVVPVDVPWWRIFAKHAPQPVLRFLAPRRS
jgi:amino-acid N-acetyltransferase